MQNVTSFFTGNQCPLQNIESGGSKVPYSTKDMRHIPKCAVNPATTQWLHIQDIDCFPRTATYRLRSSLPSAGCGTLCWGTHRMCSQTHEKPPLEQKEETRNMETRKNITSFATMVGAFFVTHCYGCRWFHFLTCH